MAVLNISLATNYDGYSSEGHNGILFHQYWDAVGAGDRDVRVVFSTEYGSDVQKSFDISCTYFGHRKGGKAQTQPVTSSVSISAANANCVAGSDGRWWWSIPLKSINSGFTGNNWSYANRTWDGLEMSFSITCQWTAPIEGMTKSSAYNATLYVNYVPTYTLVSAFYNSSGDLQIRYTATDWGRSDDRWAIDSGTVNGQEAFKANTWGTVSGYGMVIVPKDRITRDITGGQLSLRLRFNAAWRPISMDFATISTQLAGTSDPHKDTGSDPGTKVNDWTKLTTADRLYRANTPVLTAQRSADTQSVVVTVRDSGNLGKPITHAIVGFAGYGYSDDKIDVRVGGSGRLLYPPLGDNVTVYGYGLDDEGGVSDTVTVRLSGATAGMVSDDAVVIQSMADPSKLLWLRWHKDGETNLPTVKVTPNTEIVQLSGRKRPSVYFGEGGTCDVNFSGWLVPELNDSSPQEYGEMVETGVFMCRFYDGSRYVVSGDVTTEPDSAGDYKVSVSGQEVDA